MAFCSRYETRFSFEMNKTLLYNNQFLNHDDQFIKTQDIHKSKVHNSYIWALETYLNYILVGTNCDPYTNLIYISLI